MTLDEVKRQLFADSDDVIGNDMVDLYVFLIKLKIKIKLQKEEKFKEILKDKKMEYNKRIYI